MYETSGLVIFFITENIQIQLSQMFMMMMMSKQALVIMVNCL